MNSRHKAKCNISGNPIRNIVVGRLENLSEQKLLKE